MCANVAAGANWVAYCVEASVTRFCWALLLRHCTAPVYYLGSTGLPHDQPLTAPDVVDTSSATCVAWLSRLM